MNEYVPLKNEPEIVLNANRGDFKAFEKLYRHYQGLVFSVFQKMLFGFPEEIEDACQEVWRKAYFRLGLYDHNLGSFASWISQRARWKAIEILKYRRARPLYYTDQPLEVPFYWNHPSAKNARLRESEIARPVEELLGRLTASERRVMELIILERSPTEIARELRTTRSNVDLLVHRARKKLRPFRSILTAA